MKKTCIVYSRISSDKQTKYNNSYLSLHTQRIQCEDYAKNNNLKIIKFYQEVYSAKDMRKLKILNELINTNGNVILLVRSVSRFSRNVSQGIEYYNKMKERNILPIFVQDNLIVDDNPHNLARYISLLSTAQLESEIISQRVKNNLNTIRQLGGHVGSLEYGFKSKEKDGIRVKVINQYEQDVIKFILCAKKGNCTSRILSILMYKISKDNQKVPIYFYDKDGSIIRKFDNPYTLTYQEISNLLNDYNVTHRGKSWTSSSIGRICNKKIITKRKLNRLTNDLTTISLKDKRRRIIKKFKLKSKTI